jgi:hypothetical protein
MAIALVIVNRPLENNLTPFKRVFRIDDPTISYPWSPDTVPKEAIVGFIEGLGCLRSNWADY